jgi:putative membrane protein
LHVACHVSRWDALASGALVVAGLAYGTAAWRQATSPAGGWRQSCIERTCFACGWAVLLVALSPPLTRLSDALFAAHMTQHEFLMLVAAPLVVLGRPLAVLPWLLPRRHRLLLRRLPGSRLSRAWERLTMPVTVLVVHGAIVWIAHVPALFEAALAHDGVHAVQHLLFFWSAALFWWALVHGRYGRFGYGMSVLFVFVTGLHTSLLGALLTFAPTVWYPTYEARAVARGGSALADQQLAGMLMWMPAGTLFLVIGLALFAAWMGQAERRARYARWNAL